MYLEKIDIIKTYLNLNITFEKMFCVSCQSKLNIRIV